jgi:hypothetical protein
MSTKTELKAIFVSGYKPSQTDFDSLIDSQLNLIDNDTDDITEGSTNKFLSSANETKLDNLGNNANVAYTISTDDPTETGDAGDDGDIWYVVD